MKTKMCEEEHFYMYLESGVGGDQTDESLDDEAKEESEASDVEIPLGSEAPHVLANGSVINYFDPEQPRTLSVPSASECPDD